MAEENGKGLIQWVRLRLDNGSRKKLVEDASKAGAEMGDAVAGKVKPAADKVEDAFKKGFKGAKEQGQDSANKTESAWRRAISAISSRFSDFTKGVITGAAFTWLTNKVKSFGVDSVAAFTAAEGSVARLDAMVRANGGNVERTGEQLLAFSSKLQDETMSQAADIELAMAQLLTYTSISGDNFERTIRLATNLEAVYGNLTQSTEALARALDDPIAGLGMLAKQGFKFEDSVVAQVRALTQQNRLLEAQDLILKDIEAQVGTVSAEMKTGMAGALDDASKAWLRLREKIGEGIVMIMGAEGGVRRATAAIKWMTDNADELIATIVALTKAIIVVGGMMVLGRFIMAVRTATMAVTTFRIALQTLLANSGIGLIVLAVAALTEAFRRAGEGAREAARQAKQAAEEFRMALQSMTSDELIMKAATLQARIDSLNEELQKLLEGGGANTDKGRKKIGELQAQIAGLDKQLRQVNDQYNRSTGRKTDGTPTVEYLIDEVNKLKSLRDARALTAAETRELAQAERDLRAAIDEGRASRDEEISALQALQREDARAKKSADDRKKAADEAKRKKDELDKKAKEAEQARDQEVRQLAYGIEQRMLTNAEIERAIELEKEYQKASLDTNLSLEDRAKARDRANTLKGAREGEEQRVLDEWREKNGFLGSMLWGNVDELAADIMEQWAPVGRFLEDTAMGFASAWGDAFALIMEDSRNLGGAFDALWRGMAASVSNALSQMAHSKVAENIAHGIEQLAKGLASSAYGNFASASAHYASAGKFGLAAAAWGVLGGAASAGAGALRSGGGGHSGVPHSGRPVGSDISNRMDIPKSEVHVYIDPLDPNRPAWQDNVHRAMGLATDRRGGYTSVHIHPSNGS